MKNATVTKTDEKQKIVKTIEGDETNVENFRRSLREFPSYCNKPMAEDGTPYLSNCVHKIENCGCSVTGNGTLQFPLGIKFCEKHS